VVPVTLTLTQTVKHRNEHGRLLSVEIRAALGADMHPAGTVHVERLNGALRDRLGALTRKTHAFAKRDASLRCTRELAAVRSQLSPSPSSFAAASSRWQASLSPSVSGHGSRADRSSLVVPGTVDDSDSFHPLMGSLPIFLTCKKFLVTYETSRPPAAAIPYQSSPILQAQATRAPACVPHPQVEGEGRRLRRRESEQEALHKNQG
jgi:hypothetical protein